MNFATFRRKFDEILSELHRNYQEMTRCIEIFRKSVTKIWKMLEIFGICEKISFFISFFHSCPYCTASCIVSPQGAVPQVRKPTGPRRTACCRRTSCSPSRLTKQARPRGLSSSRHDLTEHVERALSHEGVCFFFSSESSIINV